MSRLIPRAVIGALGVAGGLLFAAPSFADTAAVRGVSCVPAGWASDRTGCRSVTHRRAPASLSTASEPFAGRYVSLLILGVGY